MESKIKCPNCNESINVEDILSHQIEEKYKKEYSGKLSEVNSKQKSLDKLVKDKLEKEKVELAKTLSKNLKQEYEQKIMLLNKEADDQSGKIKELLKSEAENQKLKRQLSQSEAIMEVELEKRIKSSLDDLKKQAAEPYELKIKGLEIQLKDEQERAKEDLKRLQQGSQQFQGEVQELAIEDYLKGQFVYDKVEEIKKGARGADCLQHVINNNRECGLIYYESKRTKTFDNQWISKFKSDMIEKGADVGVLVTEVYPKGVSSQKFINGVWVCSYHEFKLLCVVLRYLVVDRSNHIALHQNSNEKGNMLFKFFTSAECKGRISMIIDTFSKMQADLESEKRSMERIWKKREISIGSITKNISIIYGAIEGYGGDKIPGIDNLKLNYHNNED